MLANALSLAALLALLGAAIAEAGLAAAKTTLLLRAQSHIQSGIARGTNAAVSAIASQIQSGGVLVPSPAFTPLPPVCADAACSMTVSETIAAANSAARAAAPNLESNAYVGELRIALRISVNVTAQNVQLASGAHDIVIRETLSPPYASVAGVMGGDAGNMPGTPVPCVSPSPGSSDGTIVRAEYHQSNGTACSDASAWSSGDYAQNAAPQGWSR